MHKHAHAIASLSVIVTLATAMLWAAPIANAGVTGLEHHATTRYHVVNLGSLGGGWGQAMALNDRGEVVGNSQTSIGGSYEPFLWKDGVMTNLDPVGVYGIAFGINNKGDVIGYHDTSYYGGDGFFWHDGVLTDLPFLLPLAINDQGEVLGVSGSEMVLWSHGQTTDLGIVQGYPAGAINNRGQIVGGAMANDGIHAFILDHGKLTYLDSSATSMSWATGINEAGWAVGSEITSAIPGESAAFLSHDGKTVELPGLGGNYSTATAINDRGQVLGVSTYASGAETYVLWQNDTVTDLAPLIIPPNQSGGGGGMAAINDRGDMAGTYSFTPGISSAALFVATR